jgi:hypothetical protein
MPKPKPIEELIGQRHGKLVIIGEAERHRTYKANGHVKAVIRKFICKCDCGATLEVMSTNLRGKARGCGCGRIKHGYGVGWTRGYNAKSKHEVPWFFLWKHARDRAKEKGLEFTITPEHVHNAMVERCPVLDVELKPLDKSYWDASPSLDRIDSSKGYTPENIWVISARANRIKSDATLGELKRLVAALEAKHGDCP